MSDGRQVNPRFRIVGSESPDLLTRGCYPWVCYAVTRLRFLLHPPTRAPLRGLSPFRNFPLRGGRR
jgi:hypothetical protein